LSQDVSKLIEQQRSVVTDQESPMLRKSTYNSPGEPSFFYLMMARSCFRRAASARSSKAGALRHIGHNYLTKATKVTSMLEPQLLQLAASNSL
jgi:hypothetical protein